jgi:transposase
MREIHRRTGLHRDTISRAIKSDKPPRYGHAPNGSKLDPFKDEIHRLLAKDAKLPGVVVREKLEALGFEGSKTIVDDYLREVWPLHLRTRTHQRTIYRPGELCQFDLWGPSQPIPVGDGQLRKGDVVVACLGYSRAGAGALVFSKQTEDLLFGIARCLWSLGALPETLVCDRQRGIHAHAGRPAMEFAAFCGCLKLDRLFCEPADPQAKGVVERLQGYLETNFEPGRAFANELDYQLQLDQWFSKVNARTQKTLRCRPTDRLAEERQLMVPCPRPRPTPTAASSRVSRPIPTCASTPATTRSTRGSSAAASRCASRSAKSRPSRSTRASSRPSRTGRGTQASAPWTTITCLLAGYAIELELYVTRLALNLPLND